MRDLDTFTNILPYERVLEVSYTQRFYDTSDFAFVDSTVKGAFTAVMGDYPSAAIGGIVTHGAGSVATAQGFSPAVPGTNYRTDYRFRVRIPAYGTVALLHFASQRGPGDLPALQAQLQSLQDLTDSKALFGLTAAEKAQIKNFIIP